jgi:DNA-binding GntR family transcriptional regulator
MTPSPSSPPPRQTAQQVALEHLRARLSDGTLRPDDRIRQEQLAAELGTSVIPVREALTTLQAEGLIRYVPHRGFHVARLSLDELSETYLIRRLLEDEIVRIAAPRLRDEHVATLTDALDEMERLADEGDISSMITANRQFHFTIFEAAERPRMVDFIRILWQTTDSYRSMYYAESTARRRVNDEHRSIVEALAAHDVERAVRELDQHREHAVADLGRRLESASQEQEPS